MAKHPVLLKRFAEGFQSLFGSSSRRLTRSKANKRVVKTVKSQKSQADVSASTVISSATEPRKQVASEVKEKRMSAHGSGKSVTKGGNVWSNIVWVHPWLLVGGLWLTFIVMIAIALIGLSNPGREVVLDPLSTAGPPLSAPDAAAASRLSPAGSDIAEFNQRDPAAIVPRDTTAKDMPAWPLFMMVLACAGGCMLMSHHGLLANNQSRRNQRRVIPNTTTSRSARSTIGSSGRQRRKQRRLAGHRPTSQVMAFRTGQKLHHTPPRTRPVASKPVSFAVNSEPAKSVTVVPAEESSALDWKEGSLAHRLDVRQKRSINSFLS